MPRRRVRKTNRQNVPKEILMRAVKEVLIEKKKNKTTAKKYGIPYTSLKRYCEKAPENISEWNDDALLESVTVYSSYHSRN